MSGYAEWRLKFSNPQIWTHGFVVRSVQMSETFDGADVSNTAIQTGDPSNQTAQNAFDGNNTTTWNGYLNEDIPYATLNCIWSSGKDINYIVVSFGIDYPVIQIDLQYWDDAWITKKSWTLHDASDGSYYSLSVTEAASAFVLPYAVMHTVQCDLFMPYRFDPAIADLVMPYSVMHTAQIDLEMPSAIQSFVGGAYRYWRLYITKTTSGSSLLVSPYELEMRAAVGGADQCHGGSASASHATGDAHKLFDNNTSNYWNNGSPGGSSTWVQYDFGTAVSVGEIALLARYSSQMPENFAIQASNDTASWADVAEWSGVTDWQGGIWKNFLVGTPIITAICDLEMPWLILAYPQTDVSMPYSIGEFVQSDLAMWYTIWQGAIIDLVMPYSNGLVNADLSMPYGVDVGISLSFTEFYTADRFVVLPYAFMVTTSSSLVMPYGWSVDTSESLVMPYRVLSCNEASGSLVMPYRFIGTTSPIVTMIDPHILHEGRRIDVITAEIGLSEGDRFWSGSVTLAALADFQSLTLDDAVTLMLGNTGFSVMVDSRTVTKGAESSSLSITLVSTTAALSAPRATPVSMIADEIMTAHEAATAAVGWMAWELVDWPVTSGRIAFHDAAPMAIAEAIAGAAGGVVETLPDGRLRARHRFPVRVPDWPVVEPDHVLTEDDILSVQESYRHIQRVDRVVVRDWQPTTSIGRLSIEPDSRPRGLNHGSPNYRPGSHIHVLVRASPDVTNITLKASAGELWPGNPQEWQEAMDLVFLESGTVALPAQVYSLDSWKWLGEELGNLVLAPDGATVIADRSGFSVARVRVTIRAQAWKVISPASLTGERQFPIALMAAAMDGDSSATGEVTAIRGDGIYPGDDILEPLASHVDARRERGRAVIDAGESLQDVSVSVLFNAALLPGQLVEVRDLTMGNPWRGKAKSVRHSAGEIPTTTIDLVRHVIAG